MREINTTEAAYAKGKKLKVNIVMSLRDDTRKCTYRKIECLKCGSIYDIQDQTFSRWVKVGKEHCGYCNGSQKALPPELKARQLNDKLTGSVYAELVEVVNYLGYLKEKDQAYCTLKFLSCGHLKDYSTSVFGHMLREGKAFRCNECDQTNTSEIEKVVGSKLPTHYKSQVYYNDIRDCHRKWIVDYFSIKDNTLIEVSTGHTKVRQDYSGNIAEKHAWCVENNITFIFISSLNDLEDIVQSLGKPKGANT